MVCNYIFRINSNANSNNSQYRMGTPQVCVIATATIATLPAPANQWPATF